MIIGEVLDDANMRVRAPDHRDAAHVPRVDLDLTCVSSGKVGKGGA
jgi:hypothetical protein